MPVTLKIRRSIYTSRSTIGRLALGDSDPWLWTIERPRLDLGTQATLLGPDGKNHPCIPAGIYRTQRVVYDHLGLLCFELQDVPDRTSILIHPANMASQLLGCIAPGLSNGPDYVGGSDQAYVQLMMKTAEQDVVVTIA